MANGPSPDSTPHSRISVATPQGKFYADDYQFRDEIPEAVKPADEESIPDEHQVSSSTHRAP